MKKFNHWQIAYRKKGEETFRLVSNPSYGWAADPFLVEYKGDIYLFAENYLYNSERNGIIGFCKYEEGRFGEWQIAMDKHFHLSYPNVFTVNDELYMCPESYQNEEVAVYKLKEFPDKWEKVKILVWNEKYVDTTFLKTGSDIYMFTFKPTFSQWGGNLLMLRKDEEEWSEPVCITDDRAFARPGGNFIRRDGKLYRVSQNCVKEYGNGLVFSEVKSIWPKYQESIVKKIFADDLKIQGINKRLTGVHTYNELANLEVIDLKFSEFSLREWCAQKRVRKVFLNKY